MNATVMCEKCGKPLGVFDGNICNECENKEINDVLDKIRAEIDFHSTTFKDGERYILKDRVFDIIDKYR